MIDLNEDNAELEQHLQQHYRKQYGQSPAPQVIWEQIAPRLAEQEQQAKWWKRVFSSSRQAKTLLAPLPTQRTTRKISLRLATIAIVIVLTILGGSAYATVGSGSFNELLFKTLGFGQVEHQFSDYHQSQTVNGYTVTIQKAFADSTQVVIGYTGEAPAHGWR